MSDDVPSSGDLPLSGDLRVSGEKGNMQFWAYVLCPAVDIRRVPIGSRDSAAFQAVIYPEAVICSCSGALPRGRDLPNFTDKWRSPP